MKRFISLLLVLFLMLSIVTAAIGCEQYNSESTSAPETSNNTPDTSEEASTAPEITQEPSNETVELTEPIPETTEEADLPPSPQMAYDEGYTLTSHNTFKINVHENGERVMHNARVATLRHTDGYGAVYVDILDSNNNIRFSKIWKGNAHLFLIGENTLLIYRVFLDIASDNKLCTIEIRAYQIRDYRLANGGLTTPLNETKFDPLTATEYSNTGVKTASFLNDATIRMSNVEISYHLSKMQSVFTNLSVDPYLIADNYSDPDTDITYSVADAVTPPSERDPLYDKYNLAYILNLFGIEL